MKMLVSLALMTASIAAAQALPPTSPSGRIGTVGAATTAPPPGVFRIGGGVSAPVPAVRPQPEYAPSVPGVQGEVRVAVVIDVNGIPQNLRVVKSLDAGLDQKALEAVAKWRFKPGLKDGVPVPVEATVAVTFRVPPATPKQP